MRNMRAAALIIALIGVSGCNEDEKPPVDAGWRISGKPSKEQALRFVEIDTDKAKNRTIYDAASNWLCHTHARGRLCVVAFLLPGSQIPPNDGSTIRVDPPGGWSRYSKPLAIYRHEQGASGQGSYNVWDCERAGEEGAPATALCGSLNQLYGAVLSLASRVRAGEIKLCGLSTTTDGPKTLAYIRNIDIPERQEMLQKAYDDFISFSRKMDDGTPNKYALVDNPPVGSTAWCARYKAVIERKAIEARRVLGF